MTTTPPETPLDDGPRVTSEEIRDLGRLRRTVTDRKVAGVAGGLARHLDIDPVILRVAFVVLAFFGGAGLIIYAACWLLVPQEGSDDAPVSLDERSRTIALVGVGVLAAVALVGGSWGSYWFPWPLAVIALIAFVVLSRRDRKQPPPGSGGGPVAGFAEPGAAAAYAVGEPPRNARKRGPVLFWFTLALIVLGVGVLGTIDVAGADVVASAYPALAVAITGVMLLVGSFYGRGGGLILLGLVATVGLAGASAADRWDGTSVLERPTTAAAVATTYDMETGELVLDLTDVTDLDALDGRRIDIEGGIGRLEVIVPQTGLDVEALAHIGGPGGVDVFDRETGGVDTRVTEFHDGGPHAPSITIDAELGVGEITVLTETTRSIR